MSAAFLILDDNDVFASTLARSLARRGFRAVVAHTGEEALDAARRRQAHFVQHGQHLGLALGRAQLGLVQGQALADDLAHRHARVERRIGILEDDLHLAPLCAQGGRAQVP